MYAIVDVAGQQFKVEPRQKVYVHRIDAREGDEIELKNVLLLDNDGKVTIGNPVVEGARVAATILSHVKGDKVIVFKKRRRKGYRKLNGHRQYFTQLLIRSIAGNGEKFAEEITDKPKQKKIAAKKTAVKKES